MKVLVTGGTGFIGSHTVVSLIESGHDTVIVDNLSNSRRSVLGRIEEITGIAPGFHEVDIRDRSAMAEVAAQGFDACIHFAALKAVGESVEKPLLYYDNNVSGTITLLEALTETDVTNFVFSSSATVYGNPDRLPMREDNPIGEATNPYGQSKIMMERVLTDHQRANPEWQVTLLRYFNPVGAHPSGLIGEDPHGVPNNLMPYVARVAEGSLSRLPVYGDDYPTPDGTGIRDYVHVMDLAEGHVSALQHSNGNPGVHVFNLGTGRGHSVLEVVAAYEAATGKPVPYTLSPRRSGDVAESWADVSRAEQVLGWKATRDLADMCTDSWAWQVRAR